MKALVVGSGPSNSNIDFIDSFDGIIISCDRVGRELISNGIMPDYITFSETQNDLFDEVLDFLPDSFSKIDSTIVYRPGAWDYSLVGERIEKLGLKGLSFDVESYVNNVGLYSIVFAVSLGVKEIHLIGLDHTGGRQNDGTIYPLNTYDEWVEAYDKFLYTRPDCKIIDHSKGRLS